jgi:hypothetical protein
MLLHVTWSIASHPGQETRTPRMPPKALFEFRYLPITGAVALGILFLILAITMPEERYLTVPLVLICLAVLGLGVHDLTETSHAVLRNYPVAAHLRFLLEHIRPEMRQYFFEGHRVPAGETGARQAALWYPVQRL